ncbi:MAG TPA: hypothetical protein VF997_09245, partial [Polyangia bacterium]
MATALDPRASAAAAPSHAAVTVEELRERGAISSLRDEWTRIAAAMRDHGWTKGPFLAPEWLSVYAASLCNDRGGARLGDFRMLVAHRAGRLVAALPLVVERRRLAGVPARVLRSLSDEHSQRFDLLLDPAHADDGARALVEHLAQARDWDAVELQVVADGDTAAHALVAAARAHHLPTGEWASMVSPYLTLPSSAAE